MSDRLPTLAFPLASYAPAPALVRQRLGSTAVEHLAHERVARLRSMTYVEALGDATLRELAALDSPRSIPEMVAAYLSDSSFPVEAALLLVSERQARGWRLLTNEQRSSLLGRMRAEGRSAVLRVRAGDLDAIEDALPVAREPIGRSRVGPKDRDSKLRWSGDLGKAIAESDVDAIERSIGERVDDALAWLGAHPAEWAAIANEPRFVRAVSAWLPFAAPSTVASCGLPDAWNRPPEDERALVLGSSRAAVDRSLRRVEALSRSPRSEQAKAALELELARVAHFADAGGSWRVLRALAALSCTWVWPQVDEWIGSVYWCGLARAAGAATGAGLEPGGHRFRQPIWPVDLVEREVIEPDGDSPLEAMFLSSGETCRWMWLERLPDARAFDVSPFLARTAKGERVRAELVASWPAESTGLFRVVRVRDDHSG